MIRPAPGRVIVGVDESPAGLRALRVAATQAKFQDTELIALRVYALPPLDDDSASLAHAAYSLGRIPTIKPSQAWHALAAAREHAARGTIERAFAHALGGVPERTLVRPVGSDHAPGRILVDCAYREDDLLVLGTRAPRRLPQLRRSVSRYCTAHATCPVLVVPPHELARTVDATRPRHRWHGIERHLTATRVP